MNYYILFIIKIVFIIKIANKCANFIIYKQQSNFSIWNIRFKMISDNYKFLFNLYSINVSERTKQFVGRENR